MFNLNSPFVKVYICFTENLALHKQAWQSSTFESYTGADRAVDGQYTDLRVLAGQCAMADWEPRTAEWRVDLGGVKNIHHVFLQYETNKFVWGTASFNLIQPNVLYIQLLLN